MLQALDLPLVDRRCLAPSPALQPRYRPHRVLANTPQQQRYHGITNYNVGFYRQTYRSCRFYHSGCYSLRAFTAIAAYMQFYGFYAAGMPGFTGYG